MLECLFILSGDNMSFLVKCLNCGESFVGDYVSYRQYCSVGCQFENRCTDPDCYCQPIPELLCCKNIATDGPFEACNKIATGSYKNDHGDTVAYCEEHKSCFIKSTDSK